MMNRPLLIAAVALVAGCTGALPDVREGNSAPIGSRCFRGGDVDNFNVRDRPTAYVSTRQGYVFRLDAPADCFAPGTETLVLTPFAGSDPRVCVGEQARVAAGRSRALPVLCVVHVSGPVTDSRVSGLWSRPN